jgi:transposase-like protein
VSFNNSSLNCRICNGPCAVATRNRSIDKCVWKCPAGYEASIRTNSIFSQSHLFLQDVLHFMFCYADGLSLYKCAKLSGMSYKETAVEWAKTIREMYVEHYMSEIQDGKFSGIVEIDENLFGRNVRYHKGKPSGMKLWMFGMNERSSNRLKIFPNDKRNSATLIKLIADNIESGSTKYTDGWTAYKCLSQHGYEHYVVEHKHAFKAKYVNYTTRDKREVHTNTIEGAWKHVKQHFQRINPLETSKATSQK